MSILFYNSSFFPSLPLKISLFSRRKLDILQQFCFNDKSPCTIPNKCSKPKVKAIFLHLKKIHSMQKNT